jgi:hypothetical protein
VGTRFLEERGWIPLEIHQELKAKHKIALESPYSPVGGVGRKESK